MDISGSPSRNFLDELLASLPACRRCRQNKRRCDPDLPSCHNCSKAAVECIFYDHVREGDVSRSYIASLLRELQDAQPAESANHPAGRTSAPNTYRYIGPRACLTYNTYSHAWPAYSAHQPLCEAEPPVIRWEKGPGITPEIHKFLIDQYLSKVDCIYPFLDLAASPFTLPSHTYASSSWEQFMLLLVYATACHCVNHDGYRTLADGCHERAIKHLDQATADGTVASLQAILLLTVYSFFQPQQANTSQLIGFAARLAMDIEQHGDEEQQAMVQRIYPAIFSLENKFVTALDRPSLLPEPTGPLTFDIASPSDFVCSLHRIQSRFRNADHSAATLLRQSVPIDSSSWHPSEHSAHPNVLAVVYESFMLVDPNLTLACGLLSCYVQARYRPTFLTSHWAYKAGAFVFGIPSNPSAIDSTLLAQAFSDCTVVLERCSQRWPSSKLLKRAIGTFLHGDAAGNPARVH
ncbi:hypothetical protein BJX66DRAFT_343475 [Aspergillus keveii]|uniref:Zn(2)-C6 fungal-type domain-containing protein n=1 Tax=Aspergillus keveii TaxID=714993 RepID=A0ABR4FP57_9EURO